LPRIGVRFWHKADIRCGAMQCPLLGVKQTLQIQNLWGRGKHEVASTFLWSGPDALVQFDLAARSRSVCCTRTGSTGRKTANSEWRNSAPRGPRRIRHCGAQNVSKA